MPCRDPTCYRGTITNSGDQFKDGPCTDIDCQWPKELKPRPHYTDNPYKLVTDGAGRWWFEFTDRREKACSGA